MLYRIHAIHHEMVEKKSINTDQVPLHWPRLAQLMQLRPREVKSLAQVRKKVVVLEPESKPGFA